MYSLIERFAVRLSLVVVWPLIFGPMVWFAWAWFADLPEAESCVWAYWPMAVILTGCVSKDGRDELYQLLSLLAPSLFLLALAGGVIKIVLWLAA